MRNRAYCMKTVMIALVLHSSIVFGGVLEDVGSFIGKALDMGQKITTAPVKTVINTAKTVTGDGSIKDIYQPYREIARSAGNTIESASDLVTNPQDTIYREIEKQVHNVGGDPAVFVFDVATFQQRYLTQLTHSGALATANVLRGQNPLQITAAPLAGAIHAARERHWPRSKPLPDDVKEGLAGLIDAVTLNRARYAIGEVEITLPNFIDQGYKFMGDDYAVVC